MTRERGYTMLEIVVAMAIFGIFLFMIIVMTAEMDANRKRNPVNFMAHPQIAAVMSRLRRDVEDSDKYPDETDRYTQGSKTLLVDVLAEDGSIEHIVWDFSKPGEAHRLTFRVGAQVSQWDAYGLPDFEAEVDSYEIGGQYATRIKATNRRGQLAIDQLFTPRKH
ncbi:MAG TPA: type II secretion system protein [Thermoanaerobaculia bacterium]|nr:type II secretion system protein [Thermoanaerobaculia bacterium]